jgi:hypothetical protein
MVQADGLNKPKRIENISQLCVNHVTFFNSYVTLTGIARITFGINQKLS